MLVTPSSVTKVWTRTQHAPLYAFMRTAVRLHLRNQTIYLPTVSFVSFCRTYMGIFYHDYYSDTAPQGKIMRGNGITTFILHVAQCIILNKKKCVKTTIIAKASLKSFYSKLGFKVIKDFANSPNCEEARKQFNYESGKSKADQKKNYWLKMFTNYPTTCYISS